MAEITNQSILKIARGVPVRLYIKPTINADGTITLGAGGILDSTTHATAVEIGFTQDGIELTRGITKEGLIVDQRNSEILPAITDQDVHLKTTILQIRDYVNMASLNPGLTVMSGTGFSGMSDQLTQTITQIPVVAIAPSPNDPTKFLVIIIYAGVNEAPFRVFLGKKYSTTPLDIKAQDAGRTDGKTFAWYETL